MGSSMTGLILITQLRTVVSNCVDQLIKSAGSSVERKLYIALHRNVAANVAKSNGVTFDFIADAYRAAATLCRPKLDVRIVLENIKDCRLDKRLNASVFHRIYREVDCIFVDSDEDTNNCVGDILDDIRAAGVSPPKIVHVNVSSAARSASSTFVKDEGCQWSPAICKYGGVVMGGTFDRIHNGHKILLSMATLLAKDRVTCGVTDGPLLEKKVLSELIAPVEERIRDVSAFVKDIDSTVDQKIVPITDPFGPSIVDTDLQCIVASKETKLGAFKVNEQRVKRNLNTLDVYICDLVEDEIADMCTDDEKKVSSSKARQQLLGELLKVPKANPNISRTPYVIGLTGGIASGKSHVAKYLQSWGAVLVECDQLAHAAYLPGKPAYDKIVATFGKEVVDQANGGVINRKLLGGKVFADPAALQTLNGIVWPEIVRSANELIKKAGQDGIQVVILDAAVLFEAGWGQYVHEIWLTIVPPDEAIKRMQERNKLTEEQAIQRLKAQPLSNRERVSRSNVVFCSLWDYAVTKAQVKKAWDNLMIRLRDLK